MAVETQPEPHADVAAPSGASIVPSAQQLSLMDVWRVLLKRRYTLLVVTVLCVAASAYYAFRTPPVYESMARVEIEPNNSSNMLMQNFQNLQNAGGGGQGGQSGGDLQTEIQVLQSDSVLFQTAERLNLRRIVSGQMTKPGERSAPMPTGPITAPERRAMIGFIRSGLSVAVVQDTNLVQVAYRNTDPKMAAEVVNQLLDTFADKVLQLKYDRTTQVSQWLQRQLGGLKQQAADAQLQLADFERTHDIVGTDQNSNLTIQTLQQISNDLEIAEGDRITKEARVRQFDSLSPELKGLLSDNPALGSLVTQLSALQTQRAEMASRYGAKHPQMRQLDVEISNVQEQINKQIQLARLQVEAEYQGALGVQQSLQKRLAAEEQAAYRLNENAAEFAILTNQAELSRNLYDTLQMTLQEASVTAGLSAANITVLDSAQVPFLPVAPRKRMSLVLGLTAGLLCGCVLAFLIESIDDRLQTSEDVENIAMLPSLAAVPTIKLEGGKREGQDAGSSSPLSTVRRRLVALEDPQSHSAEAYRSLRSSLLLSSIDHPPRVILMTSALPGEGKTTTSVNLAITFAQRGERVLLVDADLRRGSLHRLFAVKSVGSGLSNVLAHPEAQRELTVPLPELPTLHVLSTGPRPPNPAEMLSSRRMEEQLQQWKKEFDRVVLDTAPVLAVSDTQSLAVYADAVVLVVRAGMTRKRALVKARDLLWRINVPIAGVVVNDVNLRLENFYTYRYGMYHYKYEYQEQDKGE